MANYDNTKAEIAALINDNEQQAITAKDVRDAFDKVLDAVNESKEDQGAIAPAEWGGITGDIDNQSDLQAALDSKQGTIADLGTIRSGAAAGATAVQPGALAVELAGKVDKVAGKGLSQNDFTDADKAKLDSLHNYDDTQVVDDITELESRVEDIEEVIPSAASAGNQLADKAFVNSSVATNTANYISDNGLPFGSLAALQAYAGALTNNDYAFVVGTDAAGNTTYTRYKYNAGTGQWAEEYVLNNSSFTAAQWAAINSGITGTQLAQMLDGIAAAYVKPQSGIPATDLASAVQTSLGKADTAVQPGSLATVATSGSYNDLTDKPTIPTVPTDIVKYTAQTLTETQKGQARENISAAENPNREYDDINPDGLGYLVLDKGRTFAEQVTGAHTIYEIRYDYDLGGETFSMPTGCVLLFVGGSVNNGTLTLDGTKLEGDVKLDCVLAGTVAGGTRLRSSWFRDVYQAASNALAVSPRFTIDRAVTLTAPLSLFGLRDVAVEATITNDATNYLEVGYSATQSLPCKVDIWNCSYIKMTGGKNLMVTVRNADTLALVANNTVSGKGSIAYCTFHLGYINNFSISGSGSGWINENTFIKGRFVTSFSIDGESYNHNNNVFYNPVFEGSLAIYLNRCQYNTFRDCRFEGAPTITYGPNSNNNRFYRSWLDTSASMWRMFYGARAVRGNGVYFDDSTFVKAFTLDRSSYLHGRDLAKVSLCDDNTSVRHELSSTYARLKITPKTDFGVIMNSDNGTMSRMTVALYDTAGVNITDTLTSYLNGLGAFTKQTGAEVYYELARDDYYAYLQVYVDNINDYLKTTYGVDSGDNPVKQLGSVKVGFNANNVRKVFNYVDFRVVFPANARDNAGVGLELPFSSPENISAANPTIKSTISGTAIPYSLLDGEECLNTTTGVLYRRTGASIVPISKAGFNGGYSSLDGTPTIPNITISSSEPTAADGADGDIWIVV